MQSRYKKSGWFNESFRHSQASKGIKTASKRIDFMYGLEEIRRINEERAKEARGKMPMIYSGNPNDLRGIPNFGDYRPKGWKLVETYFVDSSGMGQSGEMALTFTEFSRKAKKGMGYAIIEAGQFQVHIGEFKKKSEVDYAKKDDIIDLKEGEHFAVGFTDNITVAGPELFDDMYERGWLPVMADEGDVLFRKRNTWR